MKIKLFTIVLILISICFLFTGCLTSKLGVDETIVIQAIGVDLDYEKGEYKVTMQCFDLSQASSGDNGGATEKPQIITTYGKSIEQAITNTTKITGINPIYTQNRVIVLGESILKYGLNSGFDIFIRDYRTRSATPVVVAKNLKASDIIEANDKGLSPIPANTLQAITESGKINSFTKNVTVMELMKMCKEKVTSPYIPAITLEKKGEGIYTKSDGIAILKDQKLCGYLSSDETRAMLYVIDKIETGSFTLEESSIGIATLEILKSKTNTEMEITKDGSLKYNIYVECAVDLMEVNFREDCVLSKKEIIELKNDINEHIKGQMEGTINKCLIEYRCDPFRFGQMLWREKPEEFRKVNGAWENVLPNIETDISVDVKIRRVGRYGIKEH